MFAGPQNPDHERVLAQSDFEVIQRVLHGETSAFESLVRRHQQTILRLTQRMTRNAEDAEDLARRARKREPGLRVLLMERREIVGTEGPAERLSRRAGPWA